MIYIAPLAVIAILLLQWTGAIPLSSVGGPMAIALVFLIAALAVAIHEAWTEKRGALGWIVNIVVSFIGAFFGAQLGGMVAVFVLSPFMNGTSLAASGGGVMSAALVIAMGAALLGSWGALRLVKRWR